MKNNYWAHKTVEIEKGAKIGDGTKIWNNSQIKKGALIGENSIIGHNCLIMEGAIIKNNVKIQSNTDVWDKVILEDYVFVGPSVVFTNDKNPRSKYPKKKEDWLPTLIREGATIGANSVIVCGNIIGKNAFIGAGSVVITDVGDYEIFAGNPAKKIGYMCECGKKIQFLKNKTLCSCGIRYSKKGDLVNIDQ